MPQLRRSWRGKLAWPVRLSVHLPLPQRSPPPPQKKKKKKKDLDLDSLYKKFTYSSPPPFHTPPPPPAKKSILNLDSGFIVKKITDSSTLPPHSLPLNFFIWDLGSGCLYKTHSRLHLKVIWKNGHYWACPGHNLYIYSLLCPYYEEVEGANWFGPVRLSAHLPQPPPPPPPPPREKKNSLFRFRFFVQKFTYSSPPLSYPRPPSPTQKKIF